MNSSVGYFMQGSGTPIVALHSSMSSKSQWKQLAAQMAQHYNFIGVDLSGYGITPLPANRADFSLREEAAIVDEAIRKLIGNQPFHLVGHSYGGGTAMRLAYEQPQRILTLSMYEPTLFCLLNKTEPARVELQSIASAIAEFSNTDQRIATRLFIDYWNGEGSFDAIPEDRQIAMINRIEKVKLDFQALIHDPLRLYDCSALNIPVCLIAGKRSPHSTLRIADALSEALPHVIRHDINAGHMGPVTHTDEVNDIIATFVKHHEHQISLAAVGF